MKKTFNKILAGSFLALAMSACTGDYLDINSNQYQPGSLTADDYALGSSMTNLCGRVIPSDVNMCQLTDCLAGNVMGGYYADGNGNFTNSFAFYNPSNGWSRVLMEANQNSIIPTVYTNLSIVEGFAETAGDPVPLAIANIIKVAAMHRITDAYGPIPYTQIGFEGIILTPYDSQEDVYNAFFNDLDQSIATLNDNLGAALNPLIDEVYSGNVAKWVTFANSLKLRLAMRIAYANPTLAKQIAEQAVADGVMETNADNAAYRHYTQGGNPYFNATIGYGNDSRPAADIICYMNGYNDPRRATYFTKSNWVDEDGAYLVNSNGVSAEYCGVRRGWATYARDGWALNMSVLGVQPTDPTMWLSAAEVAFIRAEGVAVFGWNMGGTAEELYNKGITLSFEYNGCSAAEAQAYLADATSVPAGYYDPSGANPYNGSLPAVTIAWDDNATVEQKQERIIIQKWIANYPLGNEAWADLRRTGYPKLIPVAVNKSGGVVSSQLGPQRMPYPQEEYTNNGANVQKAVADYLKGPDNMATKLWWACKPGL